MDAICTTEITVTGRVQGVGFRYATLRIARELSLHGFVKNLPDGGVYILAQGGEDDIAKLLNWCRKGPKLSMVESVVHSIIAPREYTSFEIR